jgi:hypothetical protein
MFKKSWLKVKNRTNTSHKKSWNKHKKTANQTTYIQSRNLVQFLKHLKK